MARPSRQPSVSAPDRPGRPLFTGPATGRDRPEQRDHQHHEFKQQPVGAPIRKAVHHDVRRRRRQTERLHARRGSWPPAAYPAGRLPLAYPHRPRRADRPLRRRPPRRSDLARRPPWPATPLTAPPSSTSTRELNENGICTVGASRPTPIGSPGSCQSSSPGGGNREAAGVGLHLPDPPPAARVLRQHSATGGDPARRALRRPTPAPTRSGSRRAQARWPHVDRRPPQDRRPRRSTTATCARIRRQVGVAKLLIAIAQHRVVDLARRPRVEHHGAGLTVRVGLGGDERRQDVDRTRVQARDRCRTGDPEPAGHQRSGRCCGRQQEGERLPPTEIALGQPGAQSGAGNRRGGQQAGTDHGGRDAGPAGESVGAAGHVRLHAGHDQAADESVDREQPAKPRRPRPRQLQQAGQRRERDHAIEPDRWQRRTARVQQQHVDRR